MAWISASLVVVWLFFIMFSSYESVSGFAGCDASFASFVGLFFRVDTVFFAGI